MKKETEASGSAASSAEHAGRTAAAAETTTTPSPPKKVLKRFESMNEDEIDRLRSQLHERDLASKSKNSFHRSKNLTPGHKDLIPPVNSNT